MYEGNAKMVSVWSNEQAIREIYLKPFEISVKQGGANAVMVSWSFLGDKWTGEWGEYETNRFDHLGWPEHVGRSGGTI